MTAEDQLAIDRRLARIEGQVRGLRRMLSEGAYCCDVLNQVSAASSALNQVAASLASQHIKHCIIGHGTNDAHSTANTMTQEEVLDELDDVLARLMR